ncbi:MAG TPA: alpha/beta fold hydrolase [Bacteroidales bacterium]|nr:alpha/beta fold hydrolase [Bacteroidales bacterium]
MNAFYMLEQIPVLVSDTKTEKMPLVLLHGYLETHEIWESFRKLLDSDYRTIAVDLPGHGMSGTFMVNDMEKQADVVYNYLQKEKINEVIMAGHSMGGYVAQAFCMKYPGLSKKLVLMHSLPYPDSEEKKAVRDRDVELIKRGKLNEVAERDIPLMYAPENRIKLASVIENTIATAQIHDSDGIEASLKGMKNRPSYVTFLQTMSIPLYCIFGMQDHYISLQKAEETAGILNNAKIKILKSSGHNGFLEEPSEVHSFI